jgi:hypothetical protein
MAFWDQCASVVRMALLVALGRSCALANAGPVSEVMLRTTRTKWSEALHQVQQQKIDGKMAPNGLIDVVACSIISK